MQTSKNNISDWLEKHANPEIDKQVEKEAKHMETSIMLEKRIKQYCKDYKLKFEEYTNNGFMASSLHSIKAGMSVNPLTNRLTNVSIKKVGKKRVYESFLCYADGDIVGNGVEKTKI